MLYYPHLLVQNQFIIISSLTLESRHAILANRKIKNNRSLKVDAKFFCQILVVFMEFQLQLFFMFQVLLMENTVAFVN